MSDHNHHHSNEKRTMLVVFITILTMVTEIIVGVKSNSMALLADGIHMGSHVLAIGLSWVAYIFVRKLGDSSEFSGDKNKILSLSGYSSGLILLVFAVYIIIEAVQRFVSPNEISFKEAIIVAVIGLVVNLGCALLLKHDHEHDDHNIRSAYLHVLADALTSIAAIVGLLAASYFKILWIDAVVAIISSMVIIKWSVGLLKDSGKTLLDIKN